MVAGGKQNAEIARNLLDFETVQEMVERWQAWLERNLTWCPMNLEVPQIEGLSLMEKDPCS